jgi:protein phosphatase
MLLIPGGNSALSYQPLADRQLTSNPSHRETRSSAKDSAWSKTFATAAASDVGMRRSSNQDSFAVIVAEDREHWERSGHLLIVADGMGAHAAGELASRLSVELVPHHYAKLNRGDAPAALLRAMEETNQEIYRRGQANPEFRSMGTTTSVLAILPIGAVIAHVGDSRIYRLRGATLEQLTFDHSLVWEVRASNSKLNPDANWAVNIPKNVITRSLGPSASVEVDLEGPFELQRGDRFLLCSDGLSGQLSDEEIGVLLGTPDLDLAVRAMIDLANLRGGPDNITVVVGEATDGSLVDPTKSSTRLAPIAGSYPLAFGITAAVCALAAVVLALLMQYPLSLIATGAAIVAGFSGWLKMQLNQPAGPSGQQFGKGPHRKYQIKPTLEFCQQLQRVVDELMDWTKGREPIPTLPAMKGLLDQGNQALAAKDYRRAITRYIEVITSMMRDIKRPPEVDDEAIDY